MTKTKAAFALSIRQLARCNPSSPGVLYLWTFTLPTVVSTHEAKVMWNHLLTLMKNEFPKLQGLRVFELHDSHGVHVHMLINSWLNVKYIRPLAERAGWGRFHVLPIAVEAAASYLSKQFGRRVPCLKGWRLWDGFGGWTWTKVKDVITDNPFTRVYHACKEWMGWQSNQDFFHRVRIVNCLVRRSIIEGWKYGLGPHDKSYSSYSFHDLLGYTRNPGVFT